MSQAGSGHATASPDAELLRLAVRFRRLASALHELVASPGHGDAQASEAALLARRQRCAALRLAEVAATTEAGRLAKALVLLAVAHRDPAGNLAWDTATECLGISLARDLVGPPGAGEPRR